MAKVTVFTPAYNKPAYLLDCYKSMINQTLTDWVWWIALNGPVREVQQIATDLADLDKRIKVTEDPCTPEERSAKYQPCVLANKYWDTFDSKYIFQYSDDDLLETFSLEVLARTLDNDDAKDIVYGHCETIRLGKKGLWRHRQWYWADRPLGKGTGISPDCRIDGGQMMQTFRSWKDLNWKFPEDWGLASHVDGVYMDKLAEKYTFHPINEKVLTKRCTIWATFTHG